MTSYGCVNLLFGKLGVRLRQELNYTGPEIDSIESAVFLSFKRDDEDRHWILSMRPQVAAALVQLRWVKRREGASSSFTEGKEQK